MALDKITLSKQLKDPNYFASHDLFVDVDKNGGLNYREQVLTIKDITHEKIQDMEKTRGKNSKNYKPEELKKDAYVLHFKENYKPYVVSAKTVIESLEKACDTKIVNNWVGKQVKFYVEKDVKAFGSKTDALRVRPVPIKVEMAKCDCCKKETTLKIYTMAKEKYGVGVCSKECCEKLGGAE